jgi:hypothetical protein
MNEILHIWMKYMRTKDEELIKIGNGLKLQNVRILASKSFIMVENLKL